MLQRSTVSPSGRHSRRCGENGVAAFGLVGQATARVLASETEAGS
jgi:hypothetical protein